MSGGCTARRCRFQHGVVLPLALAMLLAMSVIALMAAHSALNSQQVARALAAQDQAFNAADAALRYCEARLRAPVAGDPIPVLDAPVVPDAEPHWRQLAVWADAAAVYRVPGHVIDRPGADRLPARCLVERFRLRNADGAGAGENWSNLRVTAIGYSPDYRVDSAGWRQAGTEVWLQSELHF